ncbi:transposase [Ruminococcus flavefaciens]|uniref:REP element-mobilizing transposase RayT n=1 Tax=Ruminococcus flavefaciens TaxID=1265 RepID=A0A1M7G5G3_RUMFL|nr:transposase [Ruminococcus flavefaciens]SHM11436.1 REP element-mobilizing transposase RayT [Ruminococcus flavefaciens]
MDRPQRKDIRLDNYDYSRSGAYFVTICTRNKMCIFWDNNDKYRPILSNIEATEKQNVGAHSVRPQIKNHDKKIHLSDIGKTVKEGLKNINHYYPMVMVDKYVIMPNHIHVIIRIEADNVGIETGGRTLCAPTLSLIIKNFKEFVTKQIGFSVWQRSFYDRVLRNEWEYRNAWQYIENNPENWENDELFSKE